MLGIQKMSLKIRKNGENAKSNFTQSSVLIRIRLRHTKFLTKSFQGTLVSLFGFRFVLDLKTGILGSFCAKDANIPHERHSRAGH